MSSSASYRPVIETGMDEGIMLARAFAPFITWARVSKQTPEGMGYFVQGVQ